MFKSFDKRRSTNWLDSICSKVARCKKAGKNTNASYRGGITEIPLITALNTNQLCISNARTKKVVSRENQHCGKVSL